MQSVKAHCLPLILGVGLLAGPAFAAEPDDAPPPSYPSVSLGYESMGSSRLKNPPDSTTGNMEIQTDMLTVKLDLPASHQDGRSRFSHGLIYRQLDFNYSNAGPEIGPLVERVHSLEYSFEWEREYGGRWSSLVLVTPGLASDFEGSLSFDDTTLEVAAIAIYDLAERWNLPGTLDVGIGAGYNPRFGTYMPMPVVGLRWNNGRDMKFEAILPQMVTFAYRPHPVIDIGATATIFGGSYHGDPDKFGVDNPRMRYSVAKAGPEVTFNILPWLRIRTSGGYAFDRRVEFYDGGHEEASYNLENEYFLGVELQIGAQ